MKRLAAIFLCLTLLLLSFPINASAVGSSYDINVSAGDGGRIARSEDGPSENGDISVDEGNDITIYIIPESHYSIDDVMVDGFSEGAISQYTFNDVTSAHSISASFVRNTNTITVAAVENGEILINGSGENGTTVTVDEGNEADIAVRPSTGYEIDSITIGATTYSTDGEIGDRSGEFSRTVTVNENISVSAEFRLAPHTITTNVGPNGALSPMNPQVSHGGDVTFTITPNPGYSIRSLSVDGNPESVDEHNQITLYNVQNDRTLSVDFAEDITYTITTVAGPNGSVTPENPEVAAGSDVTFTITPDPGYIIDELRVDGLPEMADESGQFTVFNVQRSMTLEVTFMESVAHTITIPKPAHGDIQIVGEDGVVPEGGTVIISNTGETVSYFITTDTVITSIPGSSSSYSYVAYNISSIVLQVEGGEDIDVTHDYYYDEASKQIRIDIETMFNYTIRIEFKRGLMEHWLSILNSEATSDDLIKEAVKRELGLLGCSAQVEDITIAERHSYISANGVAYDTIHVRVDNVQSYIFYTVDEYSDIVTIVYYKDGDTIKDNVFIVDYAEPLSGDVQVGMPSKPLSLIVFGPYSAEYVAIFFKDKYPNVYPENYNMISVEGVHVLQLHVANKGRQSGKELNWFPMTLITEDALCMNVQATSETGTQETFTWDLDTYPHVTLGDATQEVFFGNDRVILEKPRDNIGDIASMRAAASDSPGYTFANNSDGTITIDFLSDYYDKVTVPLTITRQSGGTVQRNLIIHRVGVDIQVHNAADGNPSSTRTVFHGTQYGNLVDFADSNEYKITASYFIPDYDDERPYGLYVTRKYADGRIETQIITQPMASPHPASADLFDPVKKAFIYNDGSSGWANVADYLIYAGPDAASAPVEVSVLVLKNAPAAGNTFGGVDYGSGTGVTWTKP